MKILFLKMNIIIRFLLSGVAVMLSAYLLPGVHVQDYWAALLVAVLVSVSNVIVRPILVLFTIPITIVTLGPKALKPLSLARSKT